MKPSYRQYSRKAERRQPDDQKPQIETADPVPPESSWQQFLATEAKLMK